MNMKLTFTLTAAAMLMAGCSRQPDPYFAQRNTGICVDRHQQRVPDNQCAQPGYSGGSSNAFLWYYLGRNSAIPYYGQTVSGGSFTRTSGATYFHAPVATRVASDVAISRGGFGASSVSHGSVGE